LVIYYPLAIDYRLARTPQRVCDIDRQLTVSYPEPDLDHRGGLLRERDEAIGSEGPAREGLVKMGQLRGERVGLRAYDEARAEPRLQRAGLGLGLGLGLG